MANSTFTDTPGAAHDWKIGDRVYPSKSMGGGPLEYATVNRVGGLMLRLDASLLGFGCRTHVTKAEAFPTEVSALKWMRTRAQEKIEAATKEYERLSAEILLSEKPSENG